MHHRISSSPLLPLLPLLLSSLLSLPHLTTAVFSPGDFNSMCEAAANFPERQETISFLDAYDSEAETTNVNKIGWVWEDVGECDNSLTICSNFTSADSNSVEVSSFDFDFYHSGRNDPVHIDTTFLCEMCPNCVLRVKVINAASNVIDSVDYDCDGSVQIEENFTQNQNFTSVRYIATFDNTSSDLQCVTIQSYRIWQYQDCPASVVDLANYSQTDLGIGPVDSTGCVENAEPETTEPASTSCSNEAVREPFIGGRCLCSAGFTPNSNLTACLPCGEGMFKSEVGNGACQSCPSNQVPNPDRTECMCQNGYTGTSCDQCIVDWFMDSGGSCMACPQGSGRAADADMSFCTCTQNRATASMSSTTTGDTCSMCAMGYRRESSKSVLEPCNLCDTDYFMVDGECQPCPDGSTREIEDSENFCTCRPPLVTGDGSSTTSSTSDACDTCIEGFSRLDASSPCQEIVVRFTQAQYEVSESKTAILTVEASPAPGENQEITVTISSPPPLKASPSTLDLTNSDPSNSFNITGYNDSMVLQDPRDFTISLEAPPGTLRDTAMLMVIDDDELKATFEQSEYTVAEGAGTAKVCVVLNAAVEQDVTVQIAGEMTLSSGADSATDLDQLSVNLSFPASETRKRKCHSFTVTDDSDVEEVQEQYRLTLTKVSPADPRFTAADETRIIITDDDEEEPESELLPLIIGVSVGGAVLAIILAVLCIFCLCLWSMNVKRQGFYHTHEDSQAAPTMLRYSASLRSISSQSVVAEGKRASAKENEFFV